MKRIRLVSLLAIVVIAGACASSGGSSGGSDRPRRDRNLITTADIAELSGDVQCPSSRTAAAAGLAEAARKDRPPDDLPQQHVDGVKTRGRCRTSPSRTSGKCVS